MVSWQAGLQVRIVISYSYMIILIAMYLTYSTQYTVGCAGLIVSHPWDTVRVSTIAAIHEHFHIG